MTQSKRGFFYGCRVWWRWYRLRQYRNDKEDREIMLKDPAYWSAMHHTDTHP